MKTKIFSSLAATATVAVLIVACNKSNPSANGNATSNTSGTSTTQVETQADDETQVSNEMDAATNDVNNSLNSQTAFSGSASTGYTSGVTTDGGGSTLNLDLSICDATVTTDTSNGLRQIVITYNGANCWGNRIRTGVIYDLDPCRGFAGATRALSSQSTSKT